MTEKIAFGVAGWSYPDWKGYVYPPGVADTLRYIAPFVDVIEINSTFYRPPDARTARSWAARTAGLPGFHFTAKLHKDVTHGGRVDAAMVSAFHGGLAPLAENGRLRHLLAQFRYDFCDSADSRRHLQLVRASFGDIANLVLELRNRTWMEPVTLEWLAGLGVTVANLDFPPSRDGFGHGDCTIGQHAYLRIHGRNTAAWFSRDAGRDETYNYLYNDREIDEIAARAARIAAMSASLTVIANNHYQGKEAVNILQLKSRMTGGKVAVPPLLAERYPELGKIASTGSCSAPGAS
jgi:uncharacterized protein YecE (DUF72 family)